MYLPFACANFMKSGGIRTCSLRDLSNSQTYRGREPGKGAGRVGEGEESACRP